MKNLSFCLARTALASVLLSLPAVATLGAVPPIGDTQGIVGAVRTRPVAGTVQSFEIWFSQTQNDRWGCLGGGPLVVYDNAYGMTAQTYKHIFALALLAQQTGKPLALDSSGTNPCSNAIQAWIVGP